MFSNFEYSTHFFETEQMCSHLMFLCLLLSSGCAELNLPLAAIARRAELFGQKIYEVCSKITAVTELRTDYLLMEPKVSSIDGTELVKEIKHTIEILLDKKVAAVKKLVEIAENAHRHHTYQEKLQITYDEYLLNTTHFELVENKRFNNVAVNLTMSTVHIPTTQYDQSTEVLNGVAWTSVLDEGFRQNYEADQFLAWQYFASHSGFIRHYPGTVWNKNGQVHGSDVFDCRLQHWYAQAAASPKDVVILLNVNSKTKDSDFEIAKETASKIILTLSENDYFNILQSNSGSSYMEPCLNGTLIQATAANKQELLNILHKFTPSSLETYDFSLTIEEALQLLSVVNVTGSSSHCNKAVMIISDAARNFDSFLTSWPTKEVRLFIFLVGKNMAGIDHMKSLACGNRGYLSQIQNIFEVHSHVQDYIHVMSRPLTMAKARPTVWTNVHLDNAGMNYVTTVVQPVLDTQNTSLGEDGLLGVMGTDVPVDSFTKAVPRFKLGVNAYAFAITNNGYIVFHPNLKTKDKGYSQTDISTVEYADTAHELVLKMVNRESGHMKMSVSVQYENKRHLVLRDNHYYFTDISDTPFSLAVALPDGYGQTTIDGVRALQDSDLSALIMEVGYLTLAPWDYCQLDIISGVDFVTQLVKYLGVVQDGLVRPTDFHERCNKELIERLLFDAEATRGAVNSWLKENWDERDDDNLVFAKNNGIEVVFLGTRAGLTRYLSLDDIHKESNFIHLHNSTIDESYYIAAVENGDEVFTFALASDAVKSGKKNLQDFAVMASTPIVISDDGHEAVVAVVGVQIKYSKFYDWFMNSTQLSCGSSNDVLCHDLCINEEVDCYLLDYNGYVMLSENSDELGKFFGEINGASSVLMNELIASAGNVLGKTLSSKFVFSRFEIFDHQALCEVWTKLKSSSSSVLFWPFFHVLKLISWLLQEITILVTHLCLYHWWLADTITASVNLSSTKSEFSNYFTTFGGRLEDYNFENALNELKPFASESLWRMWVKEVTEKLANDVTPHEIWSWLEEIRRQHLPHIVGLRPCTRMHVHYVADPMQLPQHGTVLKCDTCTKSYSIHHVPRTNLMLLAVDSLCLCNSETALSIKPVEIISNDGPVCERLKKVVHRRAPAHCYSYHLKEEEQGQCGCSGKCRFWFPALGSCILFINHIIKQH